MVNALRFRSSLPSDVLEVMILFLSASDLLTTAVAEHRGFGLAAGLSEDQMIAAEAGLLDSPLRPEQILGLVVCQLVRDRKGIPDEIWNQMLLTWGEQASIDAVFAVGFWGGMVPHILRGLDIESSNSNLSAG